MESVLRRSVFELETLNPQTKKFPVFSSYAPRRSHIDSACYRSLVRILSHCVDHSLRPPSPPAPPENAIGLGKPNLSHEKHETHLEQEGNANTNEGTPIGRCEVGGRCADGGLQEVGLVSAADLLGLDLDEFDDKYEAGVNKELLGQVMSDCRRLIDTPDGDTHWTSESHGRISQSSHEMIDCNYVEVPNICNQGADEGISHAGEVSMFAKGDFNWIEPTGHVEIVDNHMEFSEACVQGAEEGVSHISDVLETSNGNKLEKVQSKVLEESERSSMTELDDRRKIAGDGGNLICSEPIKGTNDRLQFFDETKVDFKLVEEDGERTEMQTLEDDQLNTLTHQSHEGEFEEGEIPDEIQDLVGLVDINDKGKVQGPSKHDFNVVASPTPFIHMKKAFELGTGYNSSTVERCGGSAHFEANFSDASEKDSTDEETQIKEMVMTREKKQVRQLTEERKAKKKIAKKRKRAQKNREQGVKKLKLHAILKPKEVKICTFYLKGRCQQGNHCKYSHDAPLEKSAPCKYFACNSCLKGDDCTYDHDLSKYPCHKYVSTGSCIRGVGCKFSHKMPSTDASQLTSCKMDSDLTPEQSRLKNQPIRVDQSSFESYNKGTPSVKPKPLKEANQVPKGIRLLSFGVTNKVRESLPVKKPGYNGAYSQQRQHGLFVHGHHHNAFSAMSGGLIGDASPNGFAIKDSGNITKEFPITFPRTVNREISEATQILEEFLLCDAS